MKNFSFTAKAGTNKSLFVDLSLPSGTKTGRLYMTPAGGSETLLNGAVTGVTNNGASLTIPSASITTAAFPATFRLQVNVNGGAFSDYATGQGFLEAAAAGETEIKNESGAAISVGGIDLAGLPTTLRTDSFGRLKTSHGQPVPITGNVTAVGNTVFASMDGFSSATLYVAGTFAGLNVTFEQSPDSTNGVDGNWFPTMGANIASNSASSTSGVIAAAAGWDISAPGASYIRARATAITSGTANVIITPSTASIEPAPVIPTHPVTMTPGNPTPIAITTTATTNLQIPRTTAVNLAELSVSNPTATPAYLKLYNKATNATLASDVPLLTIAIPATSTQVFNFGVMGKRFSTGLAVAVTGAMVATDTTAAVAGIQISGSTFT